MSEGIREVDNGLAYDFGVAIARGAAGSLAVMAAQVVTITGSIYALIDAGNASDEMLRKNQLAMGGYANFLKSVDYFSEKVISGQSYFDVDNLMEGAKTLQSAGINVKKNFDLINKSAQGIGSDFSAMSQIIKNGDYSALAEAGLITERMATNMERTTFTQEQGTKRVLALLKQADTKGLFAGNIATMTQTIERIRQIYNRFMEAILGDLKDPEGFWYILKKAFSDFADFFAKRMDKIQKIGAFVGKILGFVIRSIAGFMRFMGRTLQKVLGNNDDFFSNWQEKMLSFGLWLEILRVKIGAFFESWGPLIIKLWLFNSALNAIWMAGTKLASIKKATFVDALTRTGDLMKSSGLVRIGTYIQTILIPSITTMGGSIWAALAPVIGIVAVLAAVVVALVLIVAYWDEIRGYSNGVSDSTLVLLNLLFPLAGIIMTIAKYWNEVKTIAINVGTIIRNFIDIWMSLYVIIGKYFWGRLKSVFHWLKNILKSVDNWMTATFGSAWTKFKDLFFDPIKKAFMWVKDLLSNLFDFDLGAGFNKIIEWTKALANGTKDVADTLAKKAGREGFAKEGTTLKITQKKEIAKLISEGKTDEEISTLMDNGNFDKSMIAESRKEVLAAKPIKKLAQPAKVSATSSGGGSTQTNTYHINVKNETDVNKVVKAVENANKKQDDINNRRKGN